MANTQGGTIVLGVAEKPTGLVWGGVPDAAQLRMVLWQTTVAKAFSPVPSNQVQI